MLQASLKSDVISVDASHISMSQMRFLIVGAVGVVHTEKRQLQILLRLR